MSSHTSALPQYGSTNACFGHNQETRLPRINTWFEFYNDVACNAARILPAMIHAESHAMGQKPLSAFRYMHSCPFSTAGMHGSRQSVAFDQCSKYKQP
eukprot:scaffold110447_cov29-Prasinocladus_malaysianus.AAC.1